MKNTLIFAIIFAFSFVALAESYIPVTTNNAAETIPYTERRCRDWQALGLCDRARCTELIQQGRCPVRVARQAPEERTCTGWRALGKCPRQANPASCRELIEQGKCPLHNARQTAQ